MMQRFCSGNSHEIRHVMGACTCGMYHDQTDSYSMTMFFSMPTHQPYEEEEEEEDNDYDYDQHPTYNPSYSPVDCTLSLGTPSTRLTDHQHHEKQRTTRHQPRSSITNFFSNSKNKSNRSSGSSNCSSNNINDSLLARRCANCDTTSTPLWRNGPRGPKSLCNACGIRYKKEERRAAAAATSAAATGGVLESAQAYSNHHNNSWYGHPQTQKYGNELGFMEDNSYGNSAENNGIPFMPWRLNVADRTSLVHDFTR